jgi:hypothetical protein
MHTWFWIFVSFACWYNGNKSKLDIGSQVRRSSPYPSLQEDDDEERPLFFSWQRVHAFVGLDRWRSPLETRFVCISFKFILRQEVASKEACRWYKTWGLFLLHLTAVDK